MAAKMNEIDRIALNAKCAIIRKELKKLGYTQKFSGDIVGGRSIKIFGGCLEDERNYVDQYIGAVTTINNALKDKYPDVSARLTKSKGYFRSRYTTQLNVVVRVML